jgi:NAD(P)-dependent dehydrogenase (short-subunit alcohol dehydrogenase family)
LAENGYQYNRAFIRQSKKQTAILCQSVFKKFSAFCQGKRSMIHFNNQVVLVTGAAGQLGRAVTRSFLDHGANVVCIDKASDRLQKIYPEHPEDEAHSFAVSIDVTDPESVQGMVADTIERFGRLDVLVNTVGGFRAGDPVHKTSLETWDFLMNLNARSAFLISQAVIPQMLKQGSGAIIHIGARPGLTGKANMAAYSASKSAVVSLVESMAAEYRDSGIRVNGIIPGTIDTPQNRSDMPAADTSRWVQPESLAKVILFLASEAAQDIHGAVLPVYGRS